MTMNPAPQVGKRLRLSRILRNGKAVVFAFDHGMEHGPGVLPPTSLNPREIVRIVVEAGVDAIMTTPGTARLTAEEWAGRVPLILKASGRTQLRPPEEQFLQTPLSWVEEAVALGADAIAFTIYWGTPREHDMLYQWTLLRRRAEELGMPVLQLAYPRGPHIRNRYAVEIVSYAVRAAVETGADMIKAYYTGSRETYERVIAASAGVPVLMSGGEREKDLRDFLAKVEAVMKAGAAGTVVGRNVFQSPRPHDVVKAVLDVVHKGKTAEQAYIDNLSTT